MWAWARSRRRIEENAVTSEVDIYVFSSNSITNIWAGYGAATWAVSIGNDAASNKGKATKSQKMKVGSFGILYCEPWKAFTVPFVTCSKPDPSEFEGEIWDGTWMLPFGFKPLGTPRKRLLGSELLELPGAKSREISNYSHYLKVQGNLVFNASRIDTDDWQEIVSRLV